MNLLSLVNKYIGAEVKNDEKRAVSPSGRSYASPMLKSLGLYLADKPQAQALSLADPDFVLDYGRYLYSSRYGEDVRRLNLSGRKDYLGKAAAHAHFKYLRTVARRAVKDGYLPAVDVFAQANAKLASEFVFEVQSEAASRNRYYGKAHNFQKELDKLVNCVASDLKDKNRVAKAVPALLYILGLYCYGMEFGDLLSLPALQSLDAAMLPVQGLGMRLPMPQRAIGLVGILNRQKPVDGFLLHRHADWRSIGSAALAGKLAEQLEKYLKSHSISLFLNRSVRADWLCFAREAGMRAEDVASLLTGKHSPELSDSVKRYGGILADDRGRFNKRWHVLASFAPKYGSSDLKEMVKEFLKAEGVDFNARQDFYDPQDIKRMEVRGRMVKKNNPAISRFLFVNCRADVAKMIDGMDRRFSMMRELGSRGKLATVPHRDIVMLAEFLRDFRDDVELVGLERPKDRSEFGIGVRVRILSGELKGLTGVIARIAKDKAPAPDAAKPRTRTEALKTAEDERRYAIVIDNFAMTERVTALLKGINLEPIAND